MRRAAFHPDKFDRLKDISPSDTFSEVESKALDWLRAGSRLVLLVDPETRTIHAYRSPTRIAVLMEGQHVDATDAVDGWRFSVDELFEQKRGPGSSSR
ncbi:MAG: Uma2 family endonuclease [Planctomycetota bacterium]